jgi:hypothetical protein
VDKEIHYWQYDCNLVQYKSKRFLRNKNGFSIFVYKLFTGHFIAFGDHFKILESTDVNDHERSSSRGTFPNNFLVHVLKK